MATQLLVHDRYYNHETVWSSGLVTNYHLWRFEKLAKTIVRELNKNDGEGELSPKTQRRINEIYYRRNRSK